MLGQVVVFQPLPDFLRRAIGRLARQPTILSLSDDFYTVPPALLVRNKGVELAAAGNYRIGGDDDVIGVCARAYRQIIFDTRP